MNEWKLRFILYDSRLKDSFEWKISQKDVRHFPKPVKYYNAGM